MKTLCLTNANKLKDVQLGIPGFVWTVLNIVHNTGVTSFISFICLCKVAQAIRGKVDKFYAISGQTHSLFAAVISFSSSHIWDGRTRVTVLK